MKVLIVDDDAAKIADLRSALGSVLKSGVDECVMVGDVAAAKAALRTDRFELVILDITLPLVANGVLVVDAGVGLMQEIVSQRGALLTPAHVVGMTGHQEVFDDCAGKFAAWLWTLLKYAPDRSEWRLALQGRVQHIRASAAADRPAGVVRSDVVVVTALHEPELTAVLRSAGGWAPVPVEGDPAVYWRTTKEINGVQRTVVAVAAARMGMPAAAVITSKALHAFRPALLFCCGIMAGVREKVGIGDVVVPTVSWDWGNGKWKTADDGERTFLAGPHQIALSPKARERISLLATDQAVLASAWANWPGEKPSAPPRIHLGPVASGAAVLADGVSVEGLQKQQRDLKGVEMELYAAMVAAEEAAEPRPVMVGVKAVVDFADGAKSDQWQRYAAAMSAEAMWLISAALFG